jgi:hypothetical protein
MAWKVVTLKNSVPQDWIHAARQAARPPPGECRSGHASHVWSAPAVVNRIEPAKNVVASAFGPTRSM